MAEAAVASAGGTVPEVLTTPHPAVEARRRVLVTGAGGMLGTDLCPVLAGAGYDVFARPKALLDISNATAVAAAFQDLRPEIVVNCAAFTKVDDCETDTRAMDVNARAVETLAELCQRYRAQLAQISTDFVFDGAKASPYREEDAVSPLSAYGSSKRLGEEAALRGPNSLVIRSSWLFGRGGWNFVEAIVKQVEEGKRHLSVVDDQRGRPTATVDLAEAILALLAVGAVGIYHFANRGEVSWFDFAREILRLSHQAESCVEPIDSRSLNRPASRPSYSVLDTSKYERTTGNSIRHFREPLVEYLARRARPQA